MHIRNTRDRLTGSRIKDDDDNSVPYMVFPTTMVSTNITYP